MRLCVPVYVHSVGETTASWSSHAQLWVARSAAAAATTAAATAAAGPPGGPRGHDDVVFRGVGCEPIENLHAGARDGSVGERMDTDTARGSMGVRKDQQCKVRAHVC